jgi:hypothetical protein
VALQRALAAPGPPPTATEPRPDKVIDLTARIQRSKVLDGLINEYYRGG